jgi:hypothetical protein
MRISILSLPPSPTVDVQIAVENFNVVISLDLAAHYFARRIDDKAGDTRALAHHLERHLL